jgi:hypothetical protein
MGRIYLYVPPEEYPEVAASGACWDDHSKRWYIGSDMEQAPFSRWSGEAGDTEFALVSDDALVASAQTVCVCVKCYERIEVICIYFESGIDLETDELLMQFTVSNIWASCVGQVTDRIIKGSCSRRILRARAAEAASVPR